MPDDGGPRAPRAGRSASPIDPDRQDARIGLRSNLLLGQKRQFHHLIDQPAYEQPEAQGKCPVPAPQALDERRALEERKVTVAVQQEEQEGATADIDGPARLAKSDSRQIGKLAAGRLETKGTGLKDRFQVR